MKQIQFFVDFNRQMAELNHKTVTGIEAEAEAEAEADSEDLRCYEKGIHNLVCCSCGDIQTEIGMKRKAWIFEVVWLDCMNSSMELLVCHFADRSDH
ncbi:uncharacterized protein MONOS_15363 [Monocercomonoides exilis]|uniref:uncharacterized protein n=1 Tax=Monocercomonoides exilis TaxID=2049356 RepID=UPI00355A24F2|nr:hypothetical protein MONOS_15363 [Monocercomonoides exilis]|eukprot:MONOS_15363.1-p1 / transcript=MONOS_15363.1 / gene=MONOS_15363 / organism=Monocercomonoides_exilis_PA203 / gene_product=unspecified product / transcript_product=unspecified product / location=Mono_scaffold01209:9735-10190(+) / protein_length=97 / sequence_SO=supercontig / SO=protein_coding / is_pseudo=false